MQNGISIIIHLNNRLDLDKLLAEAVKINTHHPFEMFILVSNPKDNSRKIVLTYADRYFIRIIHNPGLNNYLKKIRYPQVVHIHSQDDLQILSQLLVLTEEEQTRPEPMRLEVEKSNTAPPPAEGSQASLDELRRENELLLHQLHQVQEELEEYYLKYHELKNMSHHKPAVLKQGEALPV